METNHHDTLSKIIKPTAKLKKQRDLFKVHL